MRHANAAVFVPHNGCPHRCSFCNQNTITGSAAQLGPDDVRAAAERAAQTLPPGVPAEFAFFGTTRCCGETGAAIPRRMWKSLPGEFGKRGFPSGFR